MPWLTPSSAALLAHPTDPRPLFISVGSSEQLSKFLSLNPELSGAPALIDDSPTFEACRAAGVDGQAILTYAAQTDARFCASIGVELDVLRAFQAGG